MKEIIRELHAARARINALEEQLFKRESVEKELRQSEEKYRNFMESAPIGVCIVDASAIIQFVNRRIEEDSGWTREELIGKNGFSVGFFDDETKQLLMERLAARLKGAPPLALEIPITCKNGKRLWFAIKTTITQREGLPVTIQLAFTNISERKCTEEALRYSENLYRTIFENTGTGTAILEEDTKISMVNAEFVNMTGYTREEIESNKSWTEFVAEDDLNQLREYHCVRSIDQSLIPRNYEFRFIKKTGHAKRALLNISMIPGTKKRVASIMDVSEFRKTEAVLKQREEQLRLIADNMMDLVFQIDTKATFLYLTPSVTRLLGYTAEELLSKCAFDFVHPADLGIAMSTFSEVLATGYASVEIRCRHKSGHYLWMEMEGKTLTRDDNTEIGVLVGCRDITERKEALEKLKIVIQQLLMGINDRKRAEEALRESEQELKSNSLRLSETNIALKVLLKSRNAEKAEQEEMILLNVKELVLPYVNKLRNARLNTGQATTYIDIIEDNLNMIVSPFIQKLTSRYLNLTHKEIEIAYLIKVGKTSKEISQSLNLSTRTIDSHRDRIRKKLGLKNKKTNLRSYLLSMA